MRLPILDSRFTFCGFRPRHSQFLWPLVILRCDFRIALNSMVVLTTRGNRA